jgi:hypothetical protein
MHFYPFTTVMEGSHFISGEFDGGRFISSKNTIEDNNSITKEYQTGLIQNFEFNDRNISENETFNGLIENKYQSWIDVNYYTQSYVNANSPDKVYDEELKKAKPFSNLYGLPSRDVLSSRCYFRSTRDFGNNYYYLGAKYKIYSDFLGDNGIFDEPFDNFNEKLGFNGFTDKGWSVDTGPFYATSSATFSYSANTLAANYNKLYIKAYDFAHNLLNNSNINIEKKR